ncbi:MAG: hypothetical protein JJ895_12465 [Balneolaceae bacterium]|nr:hypothetical protein [Balneolaceae bacterium]
MIRLKWVPLPVVQKALIEKKHREISLFIYLKMTSSGYVKLDRKKRNEIRNNFSISNSTLFRYLNTLKSWNWIGIEAPKKIYLRSFKYILEIEKFQSKTAVKFTPRDLFNFQSFSFSVQVAYLLRSQNRKERRGAEQITWCSKQSPACVFKPVALRAMNKVIGLSKDTLIVLKKRSIENEYLSRKHDYKILYHVSSHSKQIYKAYPELHGLLRRVGAYIGIQRPDLFSDSHLFRRKTWS